MSTALVTALRESCGYLHDAGYRETARLVTLAADEIERLNGRVQALESARKSRRRPISRRPGAASTPIAKIFLIDPRAMTRVKA
jgi:hypothetical protein